MPNPILSVHEYRNLYKIDKKNFESGVKETAQRILDFFSTTLYIPSNMNQI